MFACLLTCLCSSSASANYKLHVEAPNLHARSPHSCPSQSNGVQTIGSRPNSKRLQNKSAKCIFTKTCKFIQSYIIQRAILSLSYKMQNDKCDSRIVFWLPQSRAASTWLQHLERKNTLKWRSTRKSRKSDRKWIEMNLAKIHLLMLTTYDSLGFNSSSHSSICVISKVTWPSGSCRPCHPPKDVKHPPEWK